MADDVTVVAENHWPEFDLELALDSTATACYLTLAVKQAGARELPATVLESLRQAEITAGIDRAAVEACCRQAQETGAAARQVVARGVLPEPGQDAFFEFHIKPFSFDPEFSTDRKGQVDFHSTHLFDNVAAGQKIASWKPAQPGRDGLSVRGEKLPAPPVKLITVQAGPGVAWHPETGNFAATRNGRVIFKDRVLSVTEEFVVDRDVDYKVGHIDFVGFVHVRGEVRDGFNVRGRKGIRVDGAVADCRLESDGDIEIAGMSGRRTGSAVIRCGGDLTTNYLNNVVVECDGKVTVKKESMHSIIKALGSVNVRGNFIGGACIARAGIEAAVIGTEFGVKTLMIAGIDFRLLKYTLEFQELLNEVQKISWEMLHKSGASARRPDLGSLSQQIAKIMQKDIETADLKSASAQPVGDNPRTEKDNTAAQANRKINVLKKLSCGTVIFLGRTVQETADARTGAFSVIEHRGRELKYLNLTPLSRNAADIEAELLKLEAEP